MDFQLNRDHLKTTSLLRVYEHFSGHKISFITPEEGENECVKFRQDPEGMCTNEATYHIRDNASTLITRAFLRMRGLALAKTRDIALRLSNGADNYLRPRFHFL